MEPVSSGPMPASTSASDAAGEGSEEGGGGARRHRAADQLYVGGIKKPKRERLGCTTAKERISKMPPSVAGKRSSIYRGVTRHRWTGRYEAHLWDKSTWNQNQNKKGKQVYLGAYDDEEAAARAYDLAALKYWGVGTLINFPVSDYSRDLEEMQTISKEDYLISLRRKSSAFSRGFPKFRGAGRHLQSSGLETTLGQILSNSMTEKRYVNVLGEERKIDLTCYIRWWSPMKTHQSYSSGRCLDEKLANPEDATRELQALECQKQPTEPYQLPSLGVPSEMKPQACSVSACDILAKSDAFKNYQQKLSESRDVKQEIPQSNSDLMYSEHGGIGSASVSLGLGSFSTQRTLYPNTSHTTALSKSTWNPVDAGPAPDFWAALTPQIALAVRKEETTYSYSCEE